MKEVAAHYVELEEEECCDEDADGTDDDELHRDVLLRPVGLLLLVVCDV